MTTLALRLSAPLQSWGVNSRFVRRGTGRHPTKSGIVGLLAAALGYRRTDNLEDLLTLTFGVRIDQPGELLRDFQTARTADGSSSMPLTNRFYLSDATFLACVEGDDSLIESLAEAIQTPAYPLYLGRRSCPPAGPLKLEVVDQPLFEVLSNHPWQASARVVNQKARNRTPAVRLEVNADVDAVPEDRRSHLRAETVRDIPLSFDPELREYGWRQVLTTYVDIPVPGVDTPIDAGGTDPQYSHDPMAALGG